MSNLEELRNRQTNLWACLINGTITADEMEEWGSIIEQIEAALE